ncbi:MAG TPA: DUF885 domain-containing protein [Planctomycetota bacterium]|nr:DUF885 domain-containing protein [Planctomycetota bacterium]
MLRGTFVLLLLSGVAMPQDVTRELADLYERYLEERAALDPEWATGVGLHQHDDQLTRWNDSAYKERIVFVEAWLQRVPEDSLDARLWRNDLLSQQYEYRRRDVRTVAPGLPFGTVSALHDMLVKDYAPKADRLANINKRLAQIPGMIDELRPKLGRPPKVWTKMAIDDGEGAIDFIATELGEADKALVAAAKAAYEKYLKFLKDELQPRSDGSFVLGKDAYEFHLKTDHVLALGVDELEKVGRREFEKTERMLEEIAKDWPAVLEKMKHDHPKPDGLLEYYRKEVARARQYMIEKKIVGIPEWEKLEVVDTPAFQQSSIPYAAYSRPGPLDSAKTGHFYVTPVAKNAKPEEAEAQLAAHNVYDIPGTVWHEAYPGHHLQFVYAKDIRSKIRKLNDSPLLSEGWGLYCEELANETGYYTDKRERLMQLNWRLQRAARILLDVALHTGKMSYDDAVKFLVEKVKLNRPQAEGSVNGYTQSPTYFPTYLLGMLEIVRIREKFRSKLADRFTLKEFHERFLAFGNVPPALIEIELDREWK